MFKYADKVYGLRQSLDAVKDGRERARIKTRVVVGSFLLILLANLGSLNALGQTKAPGQWREWLGGDLCSAKTMGRVAAVMNLGDLLADARSLCDGAGYVAIDDEKTKRKCWDIEGFTTWPQCGETVRVLRSLEETRIRRQITKEEEVNSAEWFWATSLPKSQASTKIIVLAGHGRWHIENYTFNELCTRWHADPAYKYDTHALVAALLLLFLAYNLFDAFITHNLEPQARAGHTHKYFRELIGAEFRMVFSPHASSRSP